MQPGPITPWAASIQLTAAAGDSASRLSTTTISRSSARSRRGRLSDPGAKRGQEFARRARRGMARFQKFRPGGPHGRYASGALARGFGALGGRVRFGRQRGDPLIEASGASLEVLATVAGLLGQEPRAAQQKVREPKRAPQVERDGQRPEDEQNLRRSIEPIAVRRHPIPGGLERVAPVLDRVGRRLAVQKPEDEGQHEGDRFPRGAAAPGCRRPISTE